MKTKFTLLFFLAVIFLACSNDDNLNIENTNKGTVKIQNADIQNSWKLEGFGDNSKYNKISSEDNCKSCYSLTLNKDNTFSGNTKINGIWGEYEIEEESISIQTILTKDAEEYKIEGYGYFCDYLEKVLSFASTGKSLKLYYGDKGEYMLFNLIESE